MENIITKPRDFFLMPQEVFVAFLTAWFDIVDIAKLDIAISDKHLRSYFLCAISAHGATFVHRYENRTAQYWYWLRQRSVSIKHVSWNVPSTNITILDDMQFCFRDVKSLKVNKCPNFDDDVMLKFAEICKQLTSLHLINCCGTISNSGLIEFKNRCFHLESVKFESCNNLSNDFLREFVETSPSLASLSLRCCDYITIDAILAADRSKHAPSLRVLKLEYCYSFPRLDLTGLLNSCWDLEVLSLLGSCERISDANVIEISTSCKCLKELHLDACGELTDAAFRSIAAFCPHLQRLTVDRSKHITDDGLAQVARACPALEFLSICHSRFSDRSIFAVAESCCLQLQYLHLNYCYEISDEAIVALVLSCPQIRGLHLRSLRLTPPTIAQIAHSCPNIVILDMQGVWDLDDTSLASFQRDCRRLEYFNVSDCENISDAGVTRLVHGLSFLCSVGLRGCHNVSSATRQSLRESHPHLATHGSDSWTAFMR